MENENMENTLELLQELEKRIKELPPAKCPRNHYSLSELFQQATEQVKQAWKEIRSQGGAEQCYNCHNSQRNHQLAINLLEQYWTKSKRLEKGGCHG